MRIITEKKREKNGYSERGDEDGCPSKSLPPKRPQA
jgi:hypothetical protein